MLCHRIDALPVIERLQYRRLRPRRHHRVQLRKAAGIEREPPTLGEHTDEILGEAGYEPAEIARLRRDAVV